MTKAIAGPALRAAIIAAGAALLLSGCIPAPETVPHPQPSPTTSPLPQPSVTPTPPAAGNAVAAGVKPGPSVATLNISEADAASTLAAFNRSCPKLVSRTDASNLTRGADWAAACASAATWAGPARPFFDQWFEALSVQGGTSFATGYFEPEIAGALTHLPGYDVPVYAIPPDLVRGWPDETPVEARTGRPPLGRYDTQGKFVPYFDRGEIEDGALAGKGLEIAWIKDPIDFFFLQIQGSGRLVAPDGSVVRIGYAGQNGRDYVAIGRILRDRGIFQPGEATMQKIVDWLHANPDQADEVLRQNKSWVFFRLLGAEAALGPLGALGVPVTAGDSVAADPAFTPLGAPVYLTMDRPEASGLWVAQDTGGAIKGANRFDTFWGAGDLAKTTAGGMSSSGTALILVPKGTYARLSAPAQP